MPLINSGFIRHPLKANAFFERTARRQFSITHEFLAMLLGASRPSVSVVIEEFGRRGILRVERGRILVGDREKLLKRSSLFVLSHLPVDAGA
jgi:CRP-like cAMP-binding protein